MPLTPLHLGSAGIQCGASAKLVSPATRMSALMTALGISCSRTSCQPARLSRRRCSQLVAFAASAGASSWPTADSDDDIGLGTSGSFDETELGPLPEVRYQAAMHIKDRKAWRAKAETMAREGRLVNIQIGQLGITTSFLRAAADILQKHSLVRVKLGEGCGLERREAAEVLERYLDCVCVHQIGFTVTLYRQAGLPRPSNTAREGGAEDAAAAAAAAKEAAAAASKQAAQEKNARKRAGQQKPAERPPEFSVL